MKKLLIIPLLFIYLLSVSGVVCYAHYCGAELVSLNVYTETEGCNDGGCGDESEEPDDCCKDKVVTAKVVQDQNSNEAYKLKINPVHFEASLPVLYNLYACSYHSVHYSTKIKRANAPPGLWQNLALFKLHSRYTYYG